MARFEHLDTAMPERHPLDFSVTCPSIFPFLHKPVWVEFLPDMTNQLLSSKAQLKYHLLPTTHQPPLHDWWPECPSSALPRSPCTSTWSLEWELLVGGDFILVHGSAPSPQTELDTQ